MIGITKAENNNFGPNDLNLLPLACNPAEENIVILGVPHLREEIADDIYSEAQLKAGEISKHPRQLIVCDFKAISHTIINFSNISKSYHEDGKTTPSLSNQEPIIFLEAKTVYKKELEVKLNMRRSMTSPLTSPI